MVEESPIKCDRCRRYAAIASEKESNLSSRIEAGGSKIHNKGSSMKNGGTVLGGNNLWSSRLGGGGPDKAESSFSQHSMFCSTVKRRSFGQNSTSRLSQNSNYKKILNRKFKISRDLSKYSKELDYKKSERKLLMFSKSAKGKHLTNMR